MPDDEDWRPRLTRIEDPIADDHWEYVTPQGERRTSRLTVGRPVHWPKARAWYAPVMIEGHTSPAVLPIFGSGPVDSLMNAMTFVKRFFDENSMVVPCSKPKNARSKGARAKPGPARVKRASARKPTGQRPRQR
jgi:hypothetical protein